MSAVDFLLPPRTQRMLGLLLAAPERSFTLKELLDRAGGSHSSSQAQIEKLVGAGVLVEEPRRGWQRSIRVNQSFFLYPELRSIAQKSFSLVDPLRQALEPFAPMIQEAFVFGSVAKQTDSHQSDIDLIVVGTPPFLEVCEAVLHAENAICRPVHVNIYAADEWAHLKQTDSVMAQIENGSKIQVLPQ